MPRWVVDTNVLVIANKRGDGDARPVTASCEDNTVAFLKELRASGTILLDVADEIEAEYHKNLRLSGQLDVGDLYFLSVLQGAVKVEKIVLPRTDGEFDDLPPAIAKAGFDRDDRKFAALSVKEGVPVVNAVDSDWAEHKTVLEKNGVQIKFLCGCDPDAWRE